MDTVQRILTLIKKSKGGVTYKIAISGMEFIVDNIKADEYTVLGFGCRSLHD